MSDLVSRQAAIKAIDDLPNCYNGYSDTYDKAYIIGVLEELPSVEPKKVVEDYCRPRNLMVVGAECFRLFTEPKPMKWIYPTDIVGFGRCENCKALWDVSLIRNKFFKHCPRCGHPMERSEE